MLSLYTTPNEFKLLRQPTAHRHDFKVDGKEVEGILCKLKRLAVGNDGLALDNIVKNKYFTEICEVIAHKINPWFWKQNFPYYLKSARLVTF